MKKLFKKPRVPAQLENGSKVMINLESIPLENWKTYHGTTAKGDKVHRQAASPSLPPRTSSRSSRFQFLKDKGYTVEANKNSRISS